MKDYRRRIKFMIAWIATEYPEYYERGTVQVTVQQKGDPSVHFFDCERDFIFSGMNVEVIKAFLSVHKTKANGKHCSQVNLQKYHDAIQFGAEEGRQALPQPRSGQVKKTPIKPFHLLKPSRLPGPLKKKFQLEWKPIFAMMEETPDLMIPSGSSPLSPEFIRESFDKGTAYLKSRASYIWTLKKNQRLKRGQLVSGANVSSTRQF
jgi:hypothetical protein